MKKVVLLLLLGSGLIISGTPTMDGTFDGEATWGSPIATGDGTAGWAGSNAKKLYITYDATYIYLGAEVFASEWQSWVFIINTISSAGGSTDSWARNVNYNHTQKPDYDARGHFGNYAEIHTWGGSSWTSSGSLAATEFGENIIGNDQNGWVEIRVLRTLITQTNCDVQFYVTGNSNDHGSFDAIPNDDNSTEWSGTAAKSDLINYVASVPLPVELTSFDAMAKGSGVELAWRTATETNNYGFEIERTTTIGHPEQVNDVPPSESRDERNQKSGTSSPTPKNGSVAQHDWVRIGFVEGNGTTNAPKSYSFTDNSATGKISYRLKQIDRDGKFEYSQIVEVTAASTPKEFALEQNYPNPFNPTTAISYQLSAVGFTTLKIYDAIGREVSTLVSEVKEAGTYTAQFDGARLSSGIYFAKLTSSGKTQMRKLLLLK